MLSKIILGVLSSNSIESEFTKNNPKSKHIEKRKSRMKFVLEKARPVYFYDVYRKKEKSRQIHCLYEDSTMIIYNKKTKEIITVLLLKQSEVEKYLQTTNESLSDYPSLQKSAKVHEKLQQFKELDEIDFQRLMESKLKYLNMIQ